MILFGNTSTAGSSSVSTANEMYLVPFTTPENVEGGLVQKLTCRVLTINTAGTTHFKGIITDNSLNILTNGITTTTTVPDTLSIRTQFDAVFSTPPIVSANTTYYLGFIADNTNLTLVYDSTATSYSDTTNSFSSPTNPTDATALAGSRQLEIFATISIVNPVNNYSPYVEVGNGMSRSERAT